MIIYEAKAETFCDDVINNTLTEKMSATFLVAFGVNSSLSQINSWQNSLPRVRDLIEIAKLKDINIALEYEVPYNQSRIDCLLFGKDETNIDNIVLIELKQWTIVESREDEGNFVETYTGGNTRIVAHPSQQVKGYDGYLKSFVAEFETPQPLVLFSCAYCHNYKKEDGLGLFAPMYKNIVNDFPIYSKDDTRILADKIKSLLAKGDGFEVFNRFMRSEITPSKKLLESVSKIISNEAVFSLLNEQLVAKNIICSKIKKTQKGNKKAVVIVHGGPGTGKSVIALNILAEAAKRKVKVFYACKSKPFVSGLTHLVGGEADKLISNLNRFIPSKVKDNEGDIILIDEAHRIGKTSNHQFTRNEDRTDMPQIDQIIRFAKTAVFFIDDMQNIRSLEIGSAELIRETAKKYGCSIDEVTLETQFRCMGSNNYLKWLESVLGYTQEKRILSRSEKFDFKIFNSPQKLYSALLEKEEQGIKANPGKGNFARLVAGFCWPWSQKLDSNGELVKDVVIGDFAMPWETHDKITPPKGYAKWYEWAYKKEGIKQVGCIYTAQGFEFDYIGVIVGDDLIYNPRTDRLECNISATADPILRRNKENFEKYVKNIYRVLFSRGMNGCYVYFTNKETEKYFKERIEKMKETLLHEDFDVDTFIEKIMTEIEEGKKYKEYLPVYSLSAACGKYGEGREVERTGWISVKNRKLDKDMFIVKSVGKSMEPKIREGDYCIFRATPVGSRNNKILLVQYREISDLETGGGYTIKKYQSEKIYNQDGTWKHAKITLIPLNPAYQPYVYQNESEDFESEFKVIAEFIDVVG